MLHLKSISIQRVSAASCHFACLLVGTPGAVSWETVPDVYLNRFLLYDAAQPPSLETMVECTLRVAVLPCVVSRVKYICTKDS